jgi:hypothetical protein
MDAKDLIKHVPEPISFIRAAVASVPIVGSALDHLLFDKADAIRVKNLEAAIAALSDQVAKAQESSIDKDWFNSEEALAAFKILSDKVSYEPDKAKVAALGRVVGTFGTKANSGDKTKLSVVEHLARLSGVQIHLLNAILSTQPKERVINSGGLTQTAKAIWTHDIGETLTTGPQFWEGVLNLPQELEVLESYNTIKSLQLFGASDAGTGYVLTSIGRHAASYVKQAGL